MRTRLRLTVGFLVGSVACGCNGVLGLEESTLADDASIDASKDVAAADGASDTSIDDTTMTTSDAEPDTVVTTTDAPIDAADGATTDAPADARVDAAVRDVSTPDTGCALDVPSSCGTCGRACSASNTASVSCAGGLCFPTCQAGFMSCGAPAAPGADDGCECEGTVCCGTSCATKHSNGIGNSFFDCEPLGTISQVQATAAADAWPETGTNAAGRCGNGPNASLCVTKTTATSCAVWCYSGPLAGRAKLNAAAATCACPGAASDPTWD